MLLLDDGYGSVVAVQPRLRDRLVARLGASRIDRALAEGSSPDAGAALALRARALTAGRSRRALAAGVARVMTEAIAPSATLTARLPLNRAKILGALDELQDLHGSLLADGPVTAQGVAQTKLLLTESGGPLRGRERVEDVAVVIRRTIQALSILDVTMA